MIQVACVRVGTKYGPEYVARLRAGVARHLSVPYRFVCYTDDPAALARYGTSDTQQVRAVDISDLRLPGWWSKMALFDPKLRGRGTTVYLDLDTIVLGDFSALAHEPTWFGTCRNFTQLRQIRERGTPTWPCRYGSCVMVFPEDWGRKVWTEFDAARYDWMRTCQLGGDQLAIERLVPDARILQEQVPEGFFLHYRNFPERTQPPPSARLAIFGGNATPANCQLSWARKAWTL